jgi:hypothetical protein
MKTVKYNHHGQEVSVFAELKGQHRDHCLCMVCDKFKPGTEDHCPIAKDTYENCVKHGLCTPMFECPKFVANEEKLAESSRIDLDLEDGETVHRHIKFSLDIDDDLVEPLLAKARSKIVNDRDHLLNYGITDALNGLKEATFDADPLSEDINP